MSKRLHLSALVAVLLPLGIVIAKPAESPGPLIAGAGKSDLTPPPGFPTGGHGPAGEVARGYWAPLRARAFYFRDSANNAIVLVSCDLFAIPLGLQTEVWKQIAREAAAHHVRYKDLILAATHTHQSPGNYLSAQIYNDFGSKYQGFSEDLYRFLAKRIAEAVKSAFANAGEAQVSLHSGPVTDDLEHQFVMNRSPGVFLLNWDRQHVLDQLGAGLPDAVCKTARREGEPREGWDLPGCPRLRAVDRRMTVLEVRQGTRLSAALVFFAVHPTVLLHSAPLYSPDFVGLAVESLERDWNKTSQGQAQTVAGFFNGAEGDITPRRARRDVLEVIRLAGQFRTSVEKVLAYGGKPIESRIVVKSRLVDVSQEDGRKCGSVELANTPVFGTAALGGGELDRTLLYDLGWREGVRGPALRGQGPKQPGLDDSLLHNIKLTWLFAPAQKFPRTLPVSYAEIGMLSLGAVPIEMSTTGALRIREEFERRGRYFQLLGLANEYSSYAATASEYAEQDYMGASTLWGPHETEFFACRLSELSQAPQADLGVPGNIYHPGPAERKHFGPRFAGELRELPDEGLGEILRNDKGAPERHLPFYLWDEKAGKDEFAAARTVEILDENGAVADNDEADFIRMLTKAPVSKDDKTRRWAVIWIRPLWAMPNGRYRFQIKVQGQSPKRSKLFSVDLTQTDRPHAIEAEQ